MDLGQSPSAQGFGEGLGRRDDRGRPLLDRRHRHRRGPDEVWPGPRPRRSRRRGAVVPLVGDGEEVRPGVPHLRDEGDSQGSGHDSARAQGGDRGRRGDDDVGPVRAQAESGHAGRVRGRDELVDDARAEGVRVRPEADPVDHLAVPTEVDATGMRCTRVVEEEAVGVVRWRRDHRDVVAAVPESLHEGAPPLLGRPQLGLVVVREEQDPHRQEAVCGNVNDIRISVARLCKGPRGRLPDRVKPPEGEIRDEGPCGANPASPGTDQSS